MSLDRNRRIFVRKGRPRGPRISLRTLAFIVAAIGFVAGGMQLSAAIGSRPNTLDYTAQEPRLTALTGQNVAVVDGETLRLSGHVVRLGGVAAPQRGQTCRAAVDCAGAAVVQLAALVRDQNVACTVLGHDDSGRAVATCLAGDTDINQAVIASGWARATAPARNLQQAQATAKAAHKGLWR